ncbi:Protein argonaute-2 [Diplodia intermedia]|uniref:Protein argonaute-2 n=1 Tax=Diplodia intermedia TaxID=856260 RepID=A0ABR3TMC7_9PEZI
MASGMIDDAFSLADLSLKDKAITHEGPDTAIRSTIGNCFEILTKPARICKHSISYFSTDPQGEVKSKKLKRQLLLKALEYLASNGGSKPVVDGVDTIYSMKPLHSNLQEAPSETYFDIVHPPRPSGELSSYRVRVFREQDVKFDDVARCMTDGKFGGGSDCPAKNYVRALNVLLQSVLSLDEKWFCINKNLCLSKEAMSEGTEPKPQKRRAQPVQGKQHVKLHHGMTFSVNLLEENCVSAPESKDSPFKLVLTVSPHPTLFVEACNLGVFYEDYLNKEIDNFQEDADERKRVLHSFIKRFDCTLGYSQSFSGTASGAIKPPQTPDDLRSDTRRRRIVSFGKSATEQRFKLERSDVASKDISVSSYFQEYYAYKLKHPELPVVNIGASANEIAADDKKTEVWVPMELLWVREQPIFKFPPLQTKDGFKAILKEQEDSIRNFDANFFIKSSEVARILDPAVLKDLFEITFKPTAETFKGYRLCSSPGIPQKKMRIKAPEFAESPQVIQFLTLKSGPEKHTEEEQKGLQKAYENLLEAFQTEGALRYQQQPAYDYDVFMSVLENKGNVESSLTRGFLDEKRLLFVGLEGPREEQAALQAKIRCWCDKNSIPTVFVDARKLLETMKHWTMANKETDVPEERYTCGIPSTQVISPTDLQRLKTFLAKTMVVGASLVSGNIHPSDNFPSIAAITANVKDDFVQYQGRFRLQPPEEKKIASLGDMLKETLSEYAQAHDNRLPESILYFREGVSENHFDMIRSDEIRQIAEACDKLSKETPGLVVPDAVPKITFIALSKGARPRFFPDGRGGRKPTSKNLEAGTVVDATEFQRPNVKGREFDFHLQSHSNRCDINKQCGFTSNTHYFVLQHENNWNPEEIESITNNLCHINAVPAAESYVAPVYYSGKICERGRSYLRALAPANHASLSYKQVIQEVEDSDAWPESHVLGKKMFWL